MSKQCPDCEGRGYKFERKKDFASIRRVKCPTCKGTGILTSVFKDPKNIF